MSNPVIPLIFRRPNGITPDAIKAMSPGDALPVAFGGTGANTIEEARTAFGIDEAGIKVLYEANPDTNAFTDALLAKLLGIADNANEYIHPDHSGDVTSVSDGATTIVANAVTDPKLADMPQATIKGRAAGVGTGDPGNLSGSQVTDLLRVFATTQSGIVPASGGGATNFLRADGTWAAPPGSGGGGGETNDGANVGVGGIGVFKQKQGTTLQFRNLNAADSIVKLALDTINDEIDLSLDQNQIRASSASISGFMSAADFSKLAGIAAGANLYIHPNHTGDVTSTGDGAQVIAALAVTTGKIADLAVTSAKIADATVGNTKLATMATATLKGRASAGTGAPEDFAISALTAEASPGAGTVLLAEVGGALRKVDVTTLPTGGSGEVNTGTNVGTAGVGVFKQKTGLALEFKKINAASGRVSILDDTGNNEIDVDVVENAIRVASGSLAGFMSSVDFTKLAGIEDAAELNTGLNTGQSGIGVFGRKTASQFEFRSLASLHSAIALAIATSDDTIDINLIEDNIRLVTKPGAPLTPPLGPGDPPYLGINSNRIEANERDIYFVDLMQNSEEPRIGNSQGIPQGIPVPIYPFGSPYETYPDYTGLTAGQTVTCTVASNKAGALPAGTSGAPYVLTWIGDGTLSLISSPSGAVTLLTSTTGRREYAVDTTILGPNGKLSVFTSVVGPNSLNGSDPIRNWRLWTPGNEGATGAAFLDSRMKNFFSMLPTDAAGRHTVRMGFARSTYVGYQPSSTIYYLQVPGQRPRPTWMSQGWVRGGCIEYAVAYANATNTNLWWQYNHRGNDLNTLVNDMTQAQWKIRIDEEATYARDNLNPGLEFWVEWSNETWNPQFAQYHWLLALGNANGTTQQQEHARESKFMFDAVDAVWNATGQGARVKHIIAGRTGDASWSGAILNESELLGVRVDLFAIAGYFRPPQSTLDDWIAGNPVATPDLVIDSLQDEITNALPEAMGFAITQAANYTNPLGEICEPIIYEWGQHCLPSPNGSTTFPYAQAEADAQTHPRMFDTYRQAIALYYSLGFKFAAHNATVFDQKLNTVGFWGIWGNMNASITIPVQEPYVDEGWPKAAAIYLEANDPGGGGGGGGGGGTGDPGLPGFMSPEDKTALDEIADFANLPQKLALVAADRIYIQDSENTFSRAWGTIGDLPGGTGGEANTGFNLGITGVGIFKDKVGVNLRFKRINTGSSKISVFDDTGNDEIDIDLVPANVLTSTLNNDAGWNNYVHPNHSGDVTSTSDGATVIATGVVTNAKLATMPTATFKGRATAGTGSPEDLTGAQVTNLLRLFSGTETGIVPASGGGTTAFLRADGTWAAPTGEANTAANVGTGGVGLFKQKSGTTLQFRSAAPASSKVSVALDSVNDEVDIDIVPGNILTSTLNNDANWNNYVHPNHSGDVTSVADGATTIAANAVTNTKAADMAAWTIKLRNAGTTGDPQDVTISALTVHATPGSGTLLLAEVSGQLRKVDVATLPGGTGEANTGSNVGTAGVGIFKQKTGTSLEFKKLNAGSSKVSITDDTGNSEVDVDVVPGNLLTSTLNNDAGWNAYVHPNHTGDVTSTGDGATVIASLAVTTGKLAANAVTFAKFQQIQTARILGRITAGGGNAEELTAANVLSIIGVEAGAAAPPYVTADFADSSVTFAKFQNISAAVLLGRPTGSSGAVTELDPTAIRTLINVADGANAYVHPNHTGDVTSAGDGAQTIAANAVTTAKILNSNVTYAKIQNVSATNRILGRITGGAGVLEELTAANVLSIIGVEAGAAAPPYVTADFADGAVTYAKMQSVSATNRLLGRDTTGSGVVEEITMSALRTMLSDDGVAVTSSSGSADSSKLMLLGTDGRFAKGFVPSDVAEIINFETPNRYQHLFGTGSPAQSLGKPYDTYFEDGVGQTWEKQVATVSYPKASDFGPIDYTPTDVTTSHASQRLRIFLPAGTAPASGWPVIMYSGAGNFLEHSPNATVTTSDYFLKAMLDRGVGVVWFGSTGINSSGIGIAPGLFHEPGSAGWTSFSSSNFFPEKDGIWALQHIVHNAATYGIDPNRIGGHGISSGGQTVAFGPCGVAPAFGGSDPQNTQSLQLAALFIPATPTWWDAFLYTSTSTFAPHFPTTGDAPSTTFANADAAVLDLASLDEQARLSGSYIQNTALFLAYDEPLFSENFTRSSGDPALSNTIDAAQALHSSWFGYTFVAGVLTQSTNRLSESQFYVKRSTHFRGGSHTAINTFAINDPRLLDAAAEWMANVLHAGTWVNKGHGTTTGPSVLGRANGTGLPTWLDSDGAVAVVWSNRAANVVLAKSATGTSLLQIAMPANSILGRSGSTDVGAATIGAGQIPYNNEANAGLVPTNIEDALADAGGPKANSVALSSLVNTAESKLLGRAKGAGTGAWSAIGSAVALAILWENVPQFNILASNNAAGFPDPVSVPTNSLIGRASLGVEAKTLAANEVLYRPTTGDIAPTNLASALTDAGGPENNSVNLSALKNVTGPTLIGRAVGTGAPSAQTADGVLAISYGSRTANQMVSKNDANSTVNYFTVGTNSIVGRGGTGEVTAAPLAAKEILYRPASGDLIPKNILSAVADAGGKKRKVLSADFSTTSTTEVEIAPGSGDALSFTPAINTTYYVKARLLLKTDTAGVAVNPGIIWPTGTIDRQIGFAQCAISTTNQNSRFWGDTSTGSPTATVWQNTGDYWWGLVEALVVVGGTVTGAFKVAVRSENGGTVHVGIGSFMEYEVIQSIS